MALIRTFEIAGIEVPNAYYVITGLNAQKRLVDVTINVITPEVPEVPEVPAVFDEDGNVLTEAVPAVPAVPAVTETVRTPSQIWDCNLLVSVFKDKARRDAGDTPIAYLSDVSPSNSFSTTFEYDSTTGTPPVTAGYSYLMSLPYFTTATVETSS